MQFSRALHTILVISFVALLGAAGRASADDVASLTAVNLDPCSGTACQGRDALVFVHGIYGGDDTFLNETTSFDWPRSFPGKADDRRVDIFILNYRTNLVAWAKKNNPSFEAVSMAVFDALKPLRQKKYRSIGFIAHSLGGNVISTYLHLIKSDFGHANRSQHAFVITLATPALGSKIADIASELKKWLGMSDGLLNSLKSDNLYLTMLREFRRRVDRKADRFLCRTVSLHVAYETARTGPIFVVNEDSAAASIRAMAVPPVMGFQLTHSQIAKPKGPDDAVYKWVMEILKTEYDRLDRWDLFHPDAKFENLFCQEAKYISEGP